MEYVLKTNSLSKSYKNFKALNELTMNVPKGAIYGFVGKTGPENNFNQTDLWAARAYIWWLFTIWCQQFPERNFEIPQTNGCGSGNSIYLYGFDCR